MATHDASPTLGRRPATDHGQIERVAFRLFEQHGFERTTMADIADELGVGRRTLFRYFPSKNDIPWGRFGESLDTFRQQLDHAPADIPISEAVHRCVVEFNRFDDAAMPQHATRMRLILTTPALQAHSTIRYAAWRQVIADYVARRLDLPTESLMPRLAGHVSLGLALSAYEQWLKDPDQSLTAIIADAMSALRDYLR